MELHLKVILGLCLFQAALNIAAFYVAFIRKSVEQEAPRPLPDYCTGCQKEVLAIDLRSTFHIHCFESYSKVMGGWNKPDGPDEDVEVEVCHFAGGKNGGHHSDDCRCEIDGVIR